MKKIILRIEGMTCSGCSSGLEKYLNKQKGIINANVNLVLSIATIEYENINLKDIERYIKEAGFKSLGEFKKIEEKETNKVDIIKLIILGLLIIFIMYLSMGHMLNLPNLYLLNYDNPIILSTFTLLITIIFILYGYDILKSGIKNLIHKVPNMDTLVTFSVISSLIYSIYGYINILKGNYNHLNNLYFESTCMIIYFIKLGRFIETKSKAKTKDAIKKLVQITPQKAIIKKNNQQQEVTIDEVKKDDTLICKPGQKIAVDGIVTEGKSYVDESFITGESKPVLKEKGSKVIAGSITYNGYIEYIAKKIGKQSTISEIVKLVVEATNTKTKIQKIADKISAIFTPTILIIAILTLIIQLLLGETFNNSLNHMVTVLVVACPCSIGLAVPLVVVISNGICAKKGIFLRNSEILEKALNIDTIVFDKTGTLTYGKLKISKIYNYSKYDDKTLLNIVSNIEENSSHPISTAFKSNKKLKVEDFKNIEGLGITAKINKKSYYLGNNKILEKLNIKDNYPKDYNELLENECSIIYIVENKKIIGLIGVKDIVRNNLKNAINKLKSNNIDVILLTGDNNKSAFNIAKKLNITKVVSEVTPKNKSEYIKTLVEQGKKVIMVGDGINDAPALARATIGISVNDGTDIAMDSSDVILMNNDINNILDLIKISKHSTKIIKQNLFWAFFYNSCMIPIAMGLFSNSGLTMTPTFGSIAMTISSLTVVLNSLRLKKLER